MDTKVNYTAVGIFVIILVAAITMGIIWLSSGLSLAQYNTYLIHMQESVSGLSIDSQVEYNGVNVGSVKRIDLDSENPREVNVLVNIKNNTPITQGTLATLTTRGLTGIAFIALKDKSADLQPLLAKPGEHYPVIPTSPSIFMRLDTALERASRNLDQIADAFQALLNKENLASIHGILSNLNHTTATVVNVSDQLQTQTLPMTYHVLSNLNDVSRTLTEVSAQVKQNPSILVRGVAPKPRGPGE